MKNGRVCFLSLLFCAVHSCAAWVPFNDELLLRTRVNVDPSKEKVVEDDPAIFTCDVSSLDSSAHVTWYRIGKPIDLNDENVLVETREREQSREDGVYHIVSVLRIERTSKRRHKGRYACHVTTDSDPDDKTTATALLIVIKDRGSVDLKFVQLPPEEILVEPDIPIAYRPNVDMMCTAYFKDEALTDSVYWMKNRTYEVSETRAFKSGRLMVGTLGSMIIRRPEPSDSGVYECVAQKNKHLIISRPVNIIVVHEREVHKNCTDQNGTVVPIGADYHPNEGDYCTICQCMEDPHVMSCSSEGCTMPTCANYELIHGTCCGYKCPGYDGDMTAGGTTCTDQNGTVVPAGADYHPYTGDYCTICKCSDDPYEMACSNEACDKPRCADYEPIDGTCCGYKCPGDIGNITGCKDRDGKMVEVGQMYHPDKDPCTVCECMADPNMMSCSNEACAEPTCANYTVQADTCCGYICLDVGAELDVRQVGPRAALVQWRLPDSMSPLKNVVIKYVDSSGAGSLSVDTVHVTNENIHAWLLDLDPNVRYTVSMTGTSPAEVADVVIGVETVFSLDGRKMNVDHGACVCQEKFQSNQELSAFL